MEFYPLLISVKNELEDPFIGLEGKKKKIWYYGHWSHILLILSSRISVKSLIFKDTIISHVLQAWNLISIQMIKEIGNFLFKFQFLSSICPLYLLIDHKFLPLGYKNMLRTFHSTHVLLCSGFLVFFNKPNSSHLYYSSALQRNIAFWSSWYGENNAC